MRAPEQWQSEHRRHEGEAHEVPECRRAQLCKPKCAHMGNHKRKGTTLSLMMLNVCLMLVKPIGLLKRISFS